LPSAEAKGLDFRFTPKHASWLNMAECEIAALQKQCLARRIPDKQTMKSEVAAWVKQRNKEQVRVSWTFTVQKARDKMTRLYKSRLS